MIIYSYDDIIIKMISCFTLLLALRSPASLFDRRRVCQRSGPSEARFARPFLNKKKGGGGKKGGGVEGE
jgi:hypothetical protein